MCTFKITVFGQRLIIIRLYFYAGTRVKVVANIQCEPPLVVTASKPYRFLVCVHVLLSCPLPLVDERLVPILKAVQEVLAIAKERVCTSPCLVTESTKHPAALILNDHHCCVVLSTVLIECDQTAAILV
jgi:hypothetical protein